MNFFESQDVAKRNTNRLLLLFALAVISLVLLTNLLVFVVFNYQDSYSATRPGTFYSWDLFLGTTIVVVMLIGIASLFRLNSLKRGGPAIAEMLDGELLGDAGNNIHKRKLLNVVEEMAIASGIPVPPVYLIQDTAINAFAAGYQTGDAVIGVTVGAMENLSRDQLQGVIAHEFSHILHGDMKLNIRLMGVLYGILILAIAGRLLMSSGSGRGSSRGKSQGSIAVIGIGMMAVGYVGLFFGNLIKAAVSRQREFLADASAVQYTRNPQGIAGALKRIGGYGQGTVLAHAEAEEMSHSLFCQGVKVSFSNLTATHPPLDERIARIDPTWDGQYQSVNEQEPERPEGDFVTAGQMGFASGSASGRGEKTVNTVGNPGEAELANARNIVSVIPAIFIKAAHEPYSARALIYLMLLDANPEIRALQMTHLDQSADPFVIEALAGMEVHAAEISRAARLPLLEMSISALRQLTEQQYTIFIRNVNVLIEADGSMKLSEWALQKYLTRHLNDAFYPRRRIGGNKRLKQLREDLEILLSMLAHCDLGSTVEPEEAFQAGCEELGLELNLMPAIELSFSRLNRALDALADLQPLRKPKLLKACVKIIAADDKVSPIEAELIQTVGAALDCPIPPLVTG